VRLVGVRAQNLSERSGQAEQLTLEVASSDRPDQQREAELALDAVRSRFGSRAIGLGAGGVSWESQRAREDAARLRAGHEQPTA